MSIINISCVICTEAFKSSDEVFATQCGHIYHLSCVNQWKTRNDICPTCQMKNPKICKLRVTFDDSNLSSENNDEIQVKLTSSTERAAELKEELKEAAANFSVLQKEFNAVDESKMKIKAKLTELKPANEEFLVLQREYTKASELRREIEEAISQALCQMEDTSEEIRLICLENADITHRLEKDGLVINDQKLKSKTEILKRTMNHYLKELELEVKKSDQLRTENVNLRKSILSVINHLDGADAAPGNGLIQNVRETNFLQNCEKSKAPNVMKEQNNDPSVDYRLGVCIKQFPLLYIAMPLENVILKMASIMNFPLLPSDLVKVELVKRKNTSSTKAQLYVEFKTSKMKKQFLSQNNRVPPYGDVIVDDIHDLFVYSRNKLEKYGYNLFFRNYKIFGRKNGNSELLHIQSKTQVDHLFLIKLFK